MTSIIPQTASGARAVIDSLQTGYQLISCEQRSGAKKDDEKMFALET